MPVVNGDINSDIRILIDTCGKLPPELIRRPVKGGYFESKQEADVFNRIFPTSRDLPL